MNLLRPREQVRSIIDIDYDRLYRLGKRALLFDLDNTLGGRRPARLSPEVVSLLESLTKMGFRVGILTNRRIGTKDRVIVELAAKYPLRYRAGKPRKGGFKEILEQVGVPPRKAVMIGDRLFTDVLGANRLGIYSIRVRPT
ncbi:HAD-IIIA family hydrolase [Candidatus Bipolaricaulota bacterium]|nr:HAD-IIIA family hydrolase [Candidatus Bipolaricaulota bacterium]HHR84907.1 HAD-IIIA family hydrolase [Candidatus Acetothermia bacterium]